MAIVVIFYSSIAFLPRKSLISHFLMGKFHPEAKNTLGFYYHCRFISFLPVREATHPQTFPPFGNLQEHLYHYCAHIVPNQTK